MVLTHYLSYSIQQISSIVNANQYQKYKTMNPSFHLIKKFHLMGILVTNKMGKWFSILASEYAT
jgi:hypothetical protein